MDNCVFCSRCWAKIFESKHFFVVYDEFPIREGHVLIISVRHIQHLILLTLEEFDDLYSVIQKVVEHIKEVFGTDSYNIGINDGPAAGQTVPHLHIHVIPRRLGDVSDPSGGIINFLNPLLPDGSS